MGNVRVAYKAHEEHIPEEIRSGKALEMTGNQEITCHLVFNIKMDFTQKAHFVAHWPRTEVPLSMTYSSMVAWDNVRLAFLIAVLNDLDIMS
jgi:hypothetical protein